MSLNPLLYSTQENSLQIRVGSDKIIYSVLDENDAVLLRQEINMIQGKSADNTIYEHYFNQPELNIPSDNVQIIFENSPYQLIPSEFYRSENLNLLFETEHEKLESEILMVTVIPRWGVHFVFSIWEQMHQFFTQKYPDASIEHHVGRFLKSGRNRVENTLFCLVHDNAIDLIVIKDKRLELLSNFEVSSPEDSCYFILNVYEQLELDVEDFPLNISFKSDVNLAFVQMIGEFVKNVKLEK